MELACSLQGIVRWLPIILAGFVLFTEVFEFRLAVQHCHWPYPKSTYADVEPGTSPYGVVRPHHLAIVADPQITDEYSYGRTGFLLHLTNFITDLYAKRNYWFIESVLDPDTVVILGDMFDGGRQWADEAWNVEYQRFRRIFRLDHQQNTQRPTIYNVVGNHDIGVGETIIPGAVDRYQRTFGPLNHQANVANHTLVFLDNLSLDNTHIPGLAANATQLLDELRAHPKPFLPRILFTHIPLYRPDGTDCGPHRYSLGTSILQHFGFQYQNLVREPVTRRILESVQPEAVFTGDDHDQCWIHHTLPATGDHPDPASSSDFRIPEYTIGSFSLGGGNPRPSFGLLSLHNPTGIPTAYNQTTWELQLCLLPNQISLFIRYAVVFIGVTLLLGYHTYRQLSRETSAYLTIPTSSIPFRNSQSGSPTAAAIPMEDLNPGSIDTYRGQLYDEDPAPPVRKCAANLVRKTLRKIVVTCWPALLTYFICTLYFTI
ncbi:hypothetical protein IWQ62_003319 [Dispira parvispora]|uniref:Calcineurin-like phosphoesterase domain-containing protein n=1 Tax=Dispira parvispora TaxID=1520584 RepID=A0A9W8AR36_9FUNG|nr:hypothetical protein IWQ62_003319 [Dispira parvispora]